MGNSKLVGEYMQLSILFFVLGCIPVTIFWAFVTHEAVLWFGFDEQTARIGQAFAIPYNLYQMVLGINHCLQSFLIFTDHEWYCLSSQGVAFVLQVATLMIAVGFANVNDLGLVGYVQCLTTLTFVSANFAVVIYRGWMDKYWDGFAISWSLRVSEIYRM